MPEKHASYEAFPDNNELIAHYEPKFLARGGDHLVYEVKDHPDVVIKASTFKIKDILTYNAEHGLALDSLPEKMTDWSGEEQPTQTDVEAKNEQIKELRQAFGREHTLQEKRFLMKVPVTSELLEEVFADDEFGRALPEAAKDLKEVWTIVVVQEKSEVITHKPENQEHLSLNFGSFVEKRKLHQKVEAKDIEKLNDAFIKHERVTDEDLKRFLTIQNSPTNGGLNAVVTQAEQDEHFKEMLEDVVKKIMEYSEKTGNILALAGKDNAILFQEEGEWDYLLVDAIPVNNERMFAFTKDMIHRQAEGENIWEGKSQLRITYEKELMMKVLNFVRVVNGLSASLDITDWLELVSPEDVDKVDLEELVK